MRMPRFLGLDFVEKAIDYKHAMYERMQLQEPRHLDDIESYVHNGVSEEHPLPSFPWLSPGMEISVEVGNDEETNIIRDLAMLVLPASNGISYGTPESLSALELPKPNISGTDTDDEDTFSDGSDGCTCRVPSPLMALEDIVDNACCAACHDVLEFPGGDLMVQENWHIEEIDGRTSLFIEEPVSSFHSSTVSVPSISALGARLKQRPVQDPLADSKPMSKLLASSFTSNPLLTTTNKDDDVSSDDMILQQYLSMDEFEPEVFLCQDDNLMELVEPQPTQLPVSDTPLNLCQDVLSDLQLRPEEENETADTLTGLLAKLTRSDLLVEATKVAELIPPGMDISSCSQSAEEIYIDEETSGFVSETQSYALEEPLSPSQLQCATENSAAGSNMDAALRVCASQLYAPESFNLKSSQELDGLLSSQSRHHLEHAIVETARVFDEESVHMLQVPRIIAQKSQSMHLGLSELQKILCATDWHIDGSLDLQLMWDPVAWTVAQMEISQGVIESPSEGVTEWNENNTLKVRQNIMSAALGNLLQVETEKLPSYYAGSDHLSNTDMTKGAADPEDLSQLTTTCSRKRKCTITGEDLISGLLRQPASSQIGENLDAFLLLRDIQTDSGQQAAGKTVGTQPELCRGANERGSDSGPLPEVTPAATDGVGSSTGHSANYSIKLVQMKGEIMSLYRELKYQAHCLLIQLQSDSRVPKTLTVDTITSGEVLFCLKSQQHAGSSSATGLVRLLCILETSEVLVHCGLPAALGKLNSLKEEHSKALNGGMHGLTSDLYKKQCNFQKEHILHPKAAALQDLVGKWLKTIGGSDKRVVVLVWKCSHVLLPELCDVVQQVQGMKASVFTSGSLENMPKEEIISKIEDVNCAIVRGPDTMTSAWPWHLFNLAIEYATLECTSHLSSEATSPEASACYRHAISRTNSSLKFVYIRMMCLLKDTSEEAVCSIDPFLFIASKTVMNNSHFLQILETRYNIQLVERDYEKVLCKTAARGYMQPLHPHIILDERSAVLLVPAADIASSLDVVKALIGAVGRVFCQFTTCSIVVTFYDPFSSRDGLKQSLASEFTHNMSVFLASTSHHQQSVEGTGSTSSAKATATQLNSVKVLYSSCVEHTAYYIRVQGEKARQFSSVWSPDNWARRPWITPEISTHEEFLLKFPMLNSFSAQVMLTAAPLGSLMTTSVRNLLKTCPWIPPEILEAFSSAVNHTLDGNRGFIDITPSREYQVEHYPQQPSSTSQSINALSYHGVSMDKPNSIARRKDFTHCAEVKSQHPSYWEQASSKRSGAMTNHEIWSRASTPCDEFRLPKFPDGSSPYNDKSPPMLGNMLHMKSLAAPKDLSNSPEHTRCWQQTSNNAVVHDGINGNWGGADFTFLPDCTQRKTKHCNTEMKEHMNMLASKRILHYGQSAKNPPLVARRTSSHRLALNGNHTGTSDNNEFVSSMMQIGDEWSRRGGCPKNAGGRSISVDIPCQPVTSHYFSHAKGSTATTSEISCDSKQVQDDNSTTSSHEMTDMMLLDSENPGAVNSGHGANQQHEADVEHEMNYGLSSAWMKSGHDGTSSSTKRAMWTEPLSGFVDSDDYTQLAGFDGHTQTGTLVSQLPKSLTFEKVPTLPGGQTRLVVQ